MPIGTGPMGHPLITGSVGPDAGGIYPYAVAMDLQDVQRMEAAVLALFTTLESCLQARYSVLSVRWKMRSGI